MLIDRTSVRLAAQPRYPILPGSENNPTANPNFARDAAPDSIIHFGQDVGGYRGMPLRDDRDRRQIRNNPQSRRHFGRSLLRVTPPFDGAPCGIGRSAPST